MAIIKCKNRECSHFERPLPDDIGAFCPYCDHPLDGSTDEYNNTSTSEYSTPSTTEPSFEPSVSSPNILGRTVVEVPDASLRLVHTNSSETFTIDRHSAMNKMYLGRQDGIPGDRSVIDVSNIPFAERVSRLHAYVTWDSYQNSFMIVDNNSTNGTILNSQSLTPQQSYSLKTGDRLEFGREHKVIFRVEIS